MTQTKIKDRLAKLLRLAANNPNEHEAAAAYAQAAEMAARHALNLEDIDTSHDADHEQGAPSRERIGARRVVTCKKAVLWKWSAANGIAKAHRCEAFTRTGVKSRVRIGRDTYVRTWEDDDEHGIWIYGQPSDMDAAAYLIDVILPEIDRRGTAYVAAVRSRGRADGRAFRAGMAHEIARRMQETTERVLSEARTQAYAKDGETGLARVDQIAQHVEEVKRAVEHYGKHKLKLRTSGSFADVDARGYAAGRAAGRNVNIGGNKAIG